MGPAAAKILPNTVSVLIADDHALFAEAVAGILASEERIEVVGVVTDGRQAVELAVSLTPDVTLMDISMPLMDGFEATRKIRAARPNACVLMLTGSDSTEDVNRARTSGAAGYVTKDRLEDDLVGAILELASK
jgi:DNA-binding NarL/FixJ family response regulator